MIVYSTIQKSFLPPKRHSFPLAFICLYSLSLQDSFLSSLIPFPTQTAWCFPAANLKTILWIYTCQPTSSLDSLHQDFHLFTSPALCSYRRPRKLALYICLFLYLSSLDKSVHCVSLTGPPVFCCALQSGQCTHGGQRAGSGARQPCTRNKVLPCSRTFSAAHHAKGALLSHQARIWWLFDPFWWITVLLRVSLPPLFKYTHSLPCFNIVFPLSEKCSKVHKQKSS